MPQGSPFGCGIVALGRDRLRALNRRLGQQMAPARFGGYLEIISCTRRLRARLAAETLGTRGFSWP